MNSLQQFIGSSLYDIAQVSSCGRLLEISGHGICVKYSLTAAPLYFNKLLDASLGLLCHLDDACVSNPCQKGALCDTNPVNGNYICTCPQGHKGADCTEDVDECAMGEFVFAVSARTHILSQLLHTPGAPLVLSPFHFRVFRCVLNLMWDLGQRAELVE